MMPDILRFVNSRDIRAHLQKINYPFTAPCAKRFYLV